MTEYRPFAARDHCRHPSPRLAQPAMSHGKHTTMTMNTVKPTSAHSPQPAPLPYAESLELFKRDHAMLPSGDFRDHGVRIVVGEFPTHVGG